MTIMLSRSIHFQEPYKLLLRGAPPHRLHRLPEVLISAMLAVYEYGDIGSTHGRAA